MHKTQDPKNCANKNYLSDRISFSYGTFISLNMILLAQSAPISIVGTCNLINHTLRKDSNFDGNMRKFKVIWSHLCILNDSKTQQYTSRKFGPRGSDRIALRLFKVSLAIA